MMNVPIMYSAYYECFIQAVFSDIAIFLAHQIWLVGTMQNGECKYLTSEYFDSHCDGVYESDEHPLFT